MCVAAMDAKLSVYDHLWPASTLGWHHNVCTQIKGEKCPVSFWTGTHYRGILAGMSVRLDYQIRRLPRGFSVTGGLDSLGRW